MFCQSRSCQASASGSSFNFALVNTDQQHFSTFLHGSTTFCNILALIHNNTQNPKTPKPHDDEVNIRSFEKKKSSIQSFQTLEGPPKSGTLENQKPATKFQRSKKYNTSYHIDPIRTDTHDMHALHGRRACILIKGKSLHIEEGP